VVAGVALVVERTNVSKGVALATAQQLAAKIPTAPDWGDPGKDKVRADVEPEFLSQLLEALVNRAPAWEHDGDLDLSTSFAEAPTPNLADQIAPLARMAREADAMYAAARSVGSVLSPAPPPAPAASFASTSAPAARAVPTPSDDMTTPSWAAAPMSGLAATMLALGDDSLRRQELRGAADAEINAIVTKSLAHSARTQLSKARDVRIVRKGA